MFEIKRDLVEIIKRHRAFVNGEEIDRPLFCINVMGRGFAQPYKHTFSNIPKGREVKPDDIILEDYLKDVSNFIDVHEEVGVDMFYPVVPFFYIPWMEAIIGCPIYAGRDSFYAEPFIKYWNDFKGRVDLSENNLWLKKMIEITNALVKFLEDRYPIGSSTHFRGPVDMMSAALGQKEFIFQLYDNFEMVKNMSKIYTKVFINVAVIANYIAKKSKFKGFIVNNYGIWTEEICQYYQDDAIALLSPSFYRDFVIQNHMTIDISFPSTFYHVHPISIFVIDELVKFPNLKIIEINRELKAIGPSIDKMVPILRKMQRNGKSVVINFTDIDFTPKLIEEEVGVAYRNLFSKGLCIFICVENIKDGMEKIKAVNKVFKI